MSKTYFGFGISDSMFPSHTAATRQPLTADEVREMLPNCISCLNPSHAATINAAEMRFGLRVEIPEKAPVVKLQPGDSVIVMSPRGLPRLENRHEYTAEEIASATFEFAIWTVTR